MSTTHAVLYTDSVCQQIKGIVARHQAGQTTTEQAIQSLQWHVNQAQDYINRLGSRDTVRHIGIAAIKARNVIAPDLDHWPQDEELPR
jgi:hypothetical protein